jgi:hypothetical protein
MVVSSRKVYNALLKKRLVIPTGQSDSHKYLVYDIGEYRMAMTMISHGPDHDLSASRIKDMARQCGLSRDQFLAFVNCTLSAEEYHQIQLIRLAERLKTSAS